MQALLKTIEETREAIDKVPNDKKMPLVNSLMSLAKHLIDHVVSFRDVPIRSDEVIYPALIAQIKAAEKRTETAADDIMGATEAIMNALGQVEGAGKAKIQESVNALFEACNFQDLVAQHLKEIKILSDDLAEDMRELGECMGALGGSNENADNVVTVRKRKEKRPDSHLLNGPTTDF